MAPDGAVVGGMCHSVLLLVPDVPGDICMYIYIHTEVYIYRQVYNKEECTNLKSNLHPTAVKIEFPYWHHVDTVLWMRYCQVLKALHP